MLDKVRQNKEKEVKERKKTLPPSQMRLALPLRDFPGAIRKRALIAELKKASPSKGTIVREFSIPKIISIYDRYASAISVLTDKKFFSGDIRHISEVRKLTSLPVLRKDFIIDEYQLYESRHYGADAVLLIAAMLDLRTLSRFLAISHDLGMACLVEVHSEEDLHRVLRTKAGIIGINNRNLDTLEIDLGTTLRLSAKIPEGRIIVSESGILGRDDVMRLRDSADAFLVGTSLLAGSTRNKVREIYDAIRPDPRIKVCGLTRKEDALYAAELGADYLGFIFYKKSPRYIDPAKAKKIISAVRAKYGIRCPAMVGVFVDECPCNVKDATFLDYVQLSGNESPGYAAELQAAGLAVIKALHITDSLEPAEDYSCLILLDTHHGSQYGGTGKSFDHGLLETFDRKYILSGGLNPDNVSGCLKYRPFAVDVASGIEQSPGIKDKAKMKRFFKVIK
ncbi:MAG: bifunctional indole-3-glycerol-phosphate synthase TrpC/phosphoribosylanthranilate isomerase TrpF [archaeon]